MRSFVIIGTKSASRSAGDQPDHLPEMEAGEGGDMNDHIKKMIAPIVITAVFLGYLAIYGILIFYVEEWQGKPVLLILLIPLAALGAGMVYVLYTRIREIKRGEEDDLGNY